MPLSLNGKRAVVTGGTRGIGRAIVEALLAEGVSVTLCGQTAASADRALAELKNPRAFAIGADVSNENDVADLFRFATEKMGGVDILVANAGIGSFHPAGDMPLEDWKRTIDINLTGAFLCSRHAIQAMRASGGGFIVHISSLAAKNPFAGGSAYNASKFGMNGMSEAMMLDHRRDGIRVSTIMPGSVDTEFSPGRAGKSDWKIAPEDVAQMVIAVLSMPQRTMVSRVEIRPSLPPK